MYKVLMEAIIGGSYYRAFIGSKPKTPELEGFHLTKKFVYLAVIKL